MSQKGRPSKYDPSRLEEIKNYCLLGAKDKELATFLGISESTLNKWKEDYPEFSESIKAGKEIADSMVAQSLYRRALGYEHEDVDIRTVGVGKGFSEIVQTPIIKKYPPDPTSMIFWLKNRQKDKWRERQEIDHTSDNKPIQSIPMLVVPQNLSVDEWNKKYSQSQQDDKSKP
jgi:transcriptional regulator with XRE-family HTH domain